MNKSTRWLTPVIALSLFALAACGSDDAEGDTVGSCTIVDLGDGTSAIRCPDGSELVVHNGKDGRDGTDGEKGEPGAAGEKGDKGDPGEKGEDAACTLEEVDGAHVLTCGDESVVLGDACTDGFPFDLRIAPDEEEAAKTFVLFQATNCTWVRGKVELYGPVTEFPPALRRLEKVDGNFVVGTRGVEELSLPWLVEVGGEFELHEPEDLVKVDLPSLTRLGAVYVSSAPDLETLSFAALETVDEHVYVANNAKLSDLSFPLLETVGGWLEVYGGNERLVALELPSLKEAGVIHLDSAEELESISFPSLETVGGMQIHSTGLVTIDGFPSLATVDELLSIDNNRKLKEVKNFLALERVGVLGIYSNDVLESVADFPALEEITGSEGYDEVVYVATNPALTSFGSLGSVSTIEGGVTFANNAELPQSDVDALFDGIEITGDVMICGNKGGDAC